MRWLEEDGVVGGARGDRLAARGALLGGAEGGEQAALAEDVAALGREEAAPRRHHRRLRLQADRAASKREEIMK